MIVPYEESTKILVTDILIDVDGTPAALVPAADVEEISDRYLRGRRQQLNYQHQTTNRRHLNNINQFETCLSLLNDVSCAGQIESHQVLNVHFFTEAYYKKSELCCQDIECNTGCGDFPTFLSDACARDSDCRDYLECSPSSKTCKVFAISSSE